MFNNMGYLQDIANADVECLFEKDKSYGSSWKKRGGAGAFFMLARKWDRLENQVGSRGYDVFEAVENDGGLGKKDGIIDDIRDLRRYLLLVESELISRNMRATNLLSDNESTET